MSDRPSIANVERVIAEELGTQAEAAPQQDTAPTYRVDPISKIPVSKRHGLVFKDTLDAALKARELHVRAWDEAIRYFNHDQMHHRIDGEAGRSGNRYFSMRRNTEWSETENIVYSNTAAMMPAVYAKNPQSEFSSPLGNTDTDGAYKVYIASIEALVNTIISLPDAPGVNLKVHAYQGVLSTELTNVGWIETGWIDRQNSSDAVQAEIDRIGKELAEAKDAKQVRELEGQLMALEETSDVLAPAGAFVRYHQPHCVVPDTGAMMPDFSDCKRLFVLEYYPTDYLNARYGVRDEEGNYKSVYEPTHVLMKSEGTDDVKNFKLLKDGEGHASYGYDSEAAMKRASMTKCWRVLDKITRRVYLYADNNWKYPIWVENDPYGFPGFFNFDALAFNKTPIGAYARSNVVYYLDQQDSLNEIHDEFRRARQDVKENILYNDKADRETMTAWIRGSGPNAYGVSVPEGMALKDMILEKPNALLRAAPLFDVSRVLASIDRVSGVSDVLRGAQFKTNTTNKAIENYNSSTAMRLDAKIDAVEDWLGRICYKLGFICAQFMKQDEVEALIGKERATGWRNYTAAELRTMLRCRVVGGSTQKPTSAAKKQQALELAKIMSQFAQFAPATVLEITTNVLNDSFDEVHLPPDAFKRIREEASEAMKRGNSTDGAGGGGNAPPPDDAGGGGMPPAIEAIASQVDQLPPNAKLALGQAIARGVPVAEALTEILRAVSNPSDGATEQ